MKPLSEQEREEHKFHRLTFSFKESMSRVVMASPVDDLPESQCVVLARKASKLLAVQGVSSELITYDEHTVCEIGLLGNAPLNRLARGIARNHHGARLIFDPREYAGNESLGSYGDWTNLVTVPKSLIHSARKTAGDGDTTLGHELRHLQTGTLLRNGIVTPRGIETARYMVLLSDDTGVKGGDEILCVEQDFNRAKAAYLKGSAERSPALRELESAMRGQLEVFRYEADIATTRVLQATRGLTSGPTVLHLGRHYGKGMISASFIYRGKSRELFEMNIPILRSGDVREQVISQLSGFLDLAVEGRARSREGARFVEGLKGKKMPGPSPILVSTASALKERLKSVELIVVPEEASRRKVYSLLEPLVSKLDGPGGLQTALGILHQYSNPDTLSARELEILRPAVKRILRESKVPRDLEFFCADALVTLRELDAARQLLYGAYRRGERAPEALNLLAHVESHDGGDLELSLKLAGCVTRKHGTDPGFWDTYAYALRKAGKLPNSLNAYREGVRLLDLSDPDARQYNVSFLRNFAQALRAAKKPIEAARWRKVADRL